MPEPRLKSRFIVTAAVLVGGIALLQVVGRGEKVPLHRALRNFPASLAGWQGQDAPIPQRLVDAAAVDDYVSRVYAVPGADPVDFYIGYYGKQRTGEWVHSPKNCLPAAGWEPVRAARLSVAVPGRPPILVNEYLIAKGLSRQLVLYWYHARGRVIASEYSAKFWMVADAITRNRTDVALVRILTPAGKDETRARMRATEFLQAAYPHLKDFLPE